MGTHPLGPQHVGPDPKNQNLAPLSGQRQSAASMLLSISVLSIWYCDSECGHA
jgi:hypothetical protein